MEKRRPSTPWKIAFWIGLCAVAHPLASAVRGQPGSPINLSDAEAMRIGRKVWKNECGGSINGLTSWNAGENFASLGIGHFIWYPRGARGPFEESFPKFLAFASARHVKIPDRLDKADACPWNSRADFLRAQDSAEMKELRQFLQHTVDLQAHFLVARLNGALAKMLNEAPFSERENVQRQFERLAATPQGCYALVDYVNFKGEGVLQTERYRNEGWGLLQVLEQMHGSEKGAEAVRAFSQSAASVLKRRVQNSPPERKESRWLPGWINRVNSYANS
jgi:hypothetical protein